MDHQGVPNTRLVVENPTLAGFYKDRSVAEQNSVDLSLSLLQDPSFADLQRAIYETPEEQMRFRQLVINAVMATDIADKDLKVLRNQRWDKAFNTQLHHSSSSESPKDAIDRKATIVIEHLIQASDIAHTMQHWHVYRKWNERLFVEMLSAFKAGRAEKDPGTFWYEVRVECWKLRAKLCWPVCHLTACLFTILFLLAHARYRVKLASLIITSFLWPRSSRNVVCLV